MRSLSCRLNKSRKNTRPPVGVGNLPTLNLTV